MALLKEFFLRAWISSGVKTKILDHATMVLVHSSLIEGLLLETSCVFWVVYLMVVGALLLRGIDRCGRIFVVHLECLATFCWCRD